MKKYTYLLSYHIDNDNMIYKSYYSCDEKLEGEFAITHKDYKSILTTPTTKLASYLIESTLSELRGLDYQKVNESEWEISVKVEEYHHNLFQLNNVLSNDLYILLYNSKEIITKLNSEEADIENNAEAVYEKLESLAKYANYLLIEAEQAFTINLNKRVSLDLCRKVVSEVLRVFGKETIYLFDKTEPTTSSKQMQSYQIVSKALRAISGLFCDILQPSGLSYRYTPYVSLYDYLNGLLNHIAIELGDYTQEGKETKKLKDSIVQTYSKQRILEELSPRFKQRKFVEDCMEKIGTNYHIVDCSKLDKASLAVLFYENCNYLNENLSFKQYRALFLSYYGLEDVSYKINDCKAQKEVLQRQSPMFWADIKKREK